MTDNPSNDPPSEAEHEPALSRDIGLLQAASLNVANMVGVGPFITIPLFVASMGGPQALVGWVVAAVLVLCDGLVWSELGAALPGSGGSYHFLQVIYGRYRGGRLIAFLFIWQFLISGTLELASGYIGAADYLSYAVREQVPAIDATLAEWELIQPDGTWLTQNVTGRNICAALAAIAVSISLCRHIRSLAWVAVVLCAGTLVTTLIVIVAGLANFDASLLAFPPDAFRADSRFFGGLGGAMLIAIYDYLGYYNVCHMGDEVKQPEKVIPQAVILSVLVVAAIYLCMNIAILGVVPTEQLMKSKNIAADFMEILFGRRVAIGFTFFIIWAALASVFVMTLGYSRILYAAAQRRLLPRVRLLASARSLSDGRAAVARRAHRCLLFPEATDRDRSRRDRANLYPVPGADSGAAPAAHHPPRREVALPHAPLSTAELDRRCRLGVFACRTAPVPTPCPVRARIRRNRLPAVARLPTRRRRPASNPCRRAGLVRRASQNASILVHLPARRAPKPGAPGA